MCPKCNPALRVYMTKLPSTVNFKMKGYRASSGYGAKFVDTYRSTYDGVEDGYSFTSNRGVTTEHNQGPGKSA
jgi:hypothetical protein